jgi:hypothetical protein
MASSCERGNELLGFIKSEESLDKLRKYYVFKKGSTPCVQLVS